MAVMLTAFEEERTKEFLQRLNSVQLQQSVDGDSNFTPLPWTTAVKFLMARKFEVKRAIDLYNSHQAVREREGISSVDAWDEDVRAELFSQKFTILPTRDSTGAAIALFTASRHFPTFTSHQAVLKALIFQLDAALENVETQKCGLVFIYDMTHSKYTNFDYELSIKILSLLKGSYPARLKKVLIVTAPLWFKAPFKILRLFVREKLRDRVYTSTILQLINHIPVSSLPQHFGGKLELCHSDWVRRCLQHAWRANHACSNQIDTYMAAMSSFRQPELSRHSLASLSTTVSVDSSSHQTNSDVDSDNSSVKGSLRDDLPRVENDMELSDDPTVSGTPSPLSPTSPSAGSLLGKRGSMSEPSQKPPPLPSKKRPLSDDSHPVESIHGPEPGGFKVAELVEYCRIKRRKGLCRQYAQIKAEPPSGSFEVSKAKVNLPKNRYTDVLCLDQTRVVLETGPDYINANHVDGYRHPKAYVSTQGPLPKTFSDFWRLVWQQMVQLVVMTTRTVERGRLKCGQYWPADEGDMEQYGEHYVVINNGVNVYDTYTVTSLVLQNLQADETREVTHFQFTSWPDFGVPTSAEDFLDFMEHVRRVRVERSAELGASWHGHPDGPPILVHCSAGIGRTGTFITMDICTRRLADVGTVDVQRTVRRIRSQRAFSIQMPDQYVFCHLALIEHAQRQGLLTEINLDGFDDTSSDDE